MLDFKGEKIVMKNKIDYDIEDLKLPCSIIKSPIGVSLKTVLGDSIKNDIFEKKKIKDFDKKIFDNIISPKARRIGTSLNSASRILNTYRSFKSEGNENKIKEIKEIKESKNEEKEELEEDVYKINKSDKNVSTAGKKQEFFKRNSYVKNYYMKMNQAVLGSMSEVQLENRNNIEVRIKEYVEEYNKQFDDMTFRKKDRKYEYSSKEFKEYLAQMRTNVINLNP